MTQRKRWDHGGKTRQQRGYGAAWDKLRQQVLDAEPLCRVCRDKGRDTLADAVDHITPKAKGGTDDLGNLRPICRPCHVAKTIEDQGNTPRPTIGLDGWPI